LSEDLPMTTDAPTPEGGAPEKALVPDASSAGAPPAAPAAEPVNPYLPVPMPPVMEAPEGIRYDFNDGARVAVPELSPEAGEWRVRLADAVTGNVLFDARLKAGMVASTKKYVVPFLIDVWLHVADGTVRHVLHHEMSLSGRKVLVQLPVGTLGDTLGWLPFVIRFARETGADVTCSIAEAILPLVSGVNPGITLIGHEAAKAQAGFTAGFYATYYIGLFFSDKECARQPTDFRHVGLHRTAGYILGVGPHDDTPVAINIDDDTRPVEEPYVCIAVQASTQCKYWNNPAGWRDVVTFLKDRGYRVICIDQKPVHGSGLVWNHIPHGAEDETGNRPLSERARWLKHAAFFVGLSSGLAWLAHAAGTPVVMISGFTHPDNEFATPWRVINWHTCNSCWNDPAHQFDHHDFLWCPRHAGTDRQFECTRLITSRQVNGTIMNLIRAKGLPGADYRMEKLGA
jgi:autotransporter strand-loop-strand O-heptosyltransferase